LAKYNSLDTLAKPTYDISGYGEDLFLPITTDTLTLQAITWSAVDELLQEHSEDLEAYSRLVSDIDSLGILHEGDGTRFTRQYDFLTDMSAFCYKFNLTFAVALDVTAYTSGNHSIDSVTVNFYELLPDKTQLRQIATMLHDTNMGNIGAVETKVAIMHFEGNTPFKVNNGNYLRCEIIFNSTDTGTATSFEGIMPYFYCQEGSLAKTMIESGLEMHLHASLDHAFPIFRDQSVVNKVDYSGINIDGIDRADQ
tara:strand:+ start:497 stop:1255 length:759 start_codon:yes stop_codon:yes gene_type:complete